MTARTLRQIKDILTEDPFLCGSQIEVGNNQFGEEELLIRYGYYEFVFNKTNTDCKLFGELYDTRGYSSISIDGARIKKLKFIATLHAWLVDDDSCLGEAIYDAIKIVALEKIPVTQREQNGL